MDTAEQQCNIRIRLFGMITHMSSVKEHSAKYKGILVCEGMSLHNKEFIKEESVKVIDFMAGKYGKSKRTFYLNQKDSPMFNSIEELISHYHTI